MSLASLFKPLPHSAGDHKRWGEVQGGGQALAIVEAARQHAGVSLVIASDTQTAVQLEHAVTFFAGDRLEVLGFPDWETLPYDGFSPHEDIISQRLSTLARLPTLTCGLLVVPASTLMHRLPPPEFLAGHTLALDAGQRFDLAATRGRLEQSGYRCVSTVMSHGEFAVRGAIIDLFPMGSAVPFRIELFDDEIDTLRTFDPETQRSLEKVDRIRLLPAKEFPLDSQSIRLFRDRFREQFDVDHRQCPLYQDVVAGLASAGIEYYLPLFFERLATLFDYLPDNTLVITPEGMQAAATHFYQECQSRHEELRHDIRRPLLPPHQVFLPVEELNQSLGRLARLTLSATPQEEKPGRVNLGFGAPPSLAGNARAAHPWAALEAHMAGCRSTGRRVLVCAETAGRRESLLDTLSSIGVQARSVSGWSGFLESELPVAIAITPMAQGMELPTLSVISEPQLFGERVVQSRRRKRGDDSTDQVIRNLTELRMGAAVVHIDHGVGRYRGLQTLMIDGQTQEFLMLEYAGSAKLYVPVSSLHLISRYGGIDDDAAPLHKLGTDAWSKEKRKAQEHIHDAAAELLDIYARRAAKPGHAFEINAGEYQTFANAFPFEETPDQVTAIQAVIADMTAPRPMDRLVCGDVGFGKTEVAMRAAFIAVQAGRQVAVLVPTTLLAQQHFETFKDRFAEWPVSIEVLSRFRSAKDQARALALIAEGKIDIVVGTHKLLQEDMKFKQLGLIIVDEEHRFGVRHKEKLKQLRADVDMLTLTATPIPRTLNMAFSGIRDLSIIATPPARRLSIKTFVREQKPALIKEAILRELLRGGQVYYLHNDVDTIEQTATQLTTLVPEARVGVAHGQMRERDLERVMSDFYHKRFNVLVCTTIIETGIDIPSANTIIMERADKLGLAQLHQLRGRVGRSHHQAYAYLLTPPPKALSEDANKRLEAIGLAHDLGAGFTLASHDLEIRGAGELLGEEQSGHLHAIGFSLYMEMLERAVKAIRQGKTPNLDQPLQLGAEINLRIPALIPDDYLPDVHARLILYKRLSNAEDLDQLDELRVEIIDRFGTLPNPLVYLLAVKRLQIRASALGIAKIDGGPKGGRLEFGADPRVDALSLVKLVQTRPKNFRLDGANALKFFMDSDTPEDRLRVLDEVLGLLVPAQSQGNAR